MPIGPDFQRTRTWSDINENVRIWERTANLHGIVGTDATFDFDLRVGDGACIEVYLSSVFDWRGSAHDGRDFPAESAIVSVTAGVCPKFAILVSTPARKRT